MKYVRARIELPGLETPLTDLAAADGIAGVYLLAGGVSETATPTYTLAIDGPSEEIRDRLADDEAVLEWEISSAEAGTVYAYVQFRAPPAIGRFREQFTRGSLVVLLPGTFYADGVEITVVGTQSDVATAFETLPSGFGASIREIGTFQGWFRRGRTLTDRQREVLEVAHELGYYDRPSRASQEAIAAELGCSASTVGEHLRKAEKRLVEEVFE